MPTLPTDNLYKFLALAGVVLVVVGFLLPYQARVRVEDRIYEIGSSIARIEAEQEFINLTLLYEDSVLYELALSGEDEDLAEIVDRVRVPPSHGDTADIAEIFRELYPDVENRNTVLRDWQVRARALREDVAYLRVLEARRWRITIFGWIFAAGGIILAGTGFSLWYERLQRHQDAAVRAIR